MRKILIAGVVFLMALPSATMAAGPGSGSETKYDVRIGNCHADSITVKWKLDSLMGEPTVLGSFKWSGDDDCELPYSTKIWLKVEESSGGYGYVRLSPVTPRANDGYGHNTTGSPNWSRTLCGYTGTEIDDCHDSSEAKTIWKEGDVTDFDVAW